MMDRAHSRTLRDHPTQETADAGRAMLSECARRHRQTRREAAGVLHNEVAQLLAVARLQLDRMEQRTASCPELSEVHRADTYEQCARLRDLINQALQRTRDLSNRLLPPLLDRLPLAGAVDWLCRDFAARNGAHVAFDPTDEAFSLHPAPRDALLESLTLLLDNAHRHGRAPHIRATLAADDGHLMLCVEDDGVGFDLPYDWQQGPKLGQFGLFYIDQLMRETHGHINVSSRPGHGTRVSLRTPLTGHGNPKED